MARNEGAMGQMKLARAALAALFVQSVLVVSVGDVRSAELPTMKPKRTQSVRTCNIGGMAGVLIPGSNACLKVGGYISAGIAVGK
jgi:Porin subfamily